VGVQRFGTRYRYRDQRTEAAKPAQRPFSGPETAK
jgi:hypothetical protein